MNRKVFEEIVSPMLVDDCEPIISWFKKKKLLKEEMKCHGCFKLMRWTKCASALDKFVWKCQNKDCQRFKCMTSIRRDSFFYTSRLSLQKWLLALYLWTERIGHAEVGYQLKVSAKTAVDCYSFFRDVCEGYFSRNPVKIGGPGTIIEIGNFNLSPRPKTKSAKERAARELMKVFGIVESSITSEQGYMEIVECTDVEMLFPIIKEVVLPGSIIYCDQWEDYKKLQENFNVTHDNDDDSILFLKPELGVKTDAIELYWTKHKFHMNQMQGCKRGLFQSYLYEFMWHERFPSDTLHNFCDHLALQYPFDAV